MESMVFTKMVASGNDFILIDCRVKGTPVYGYFLQDLARRLCERKFSIGADGLLVIENSGTGNFKMRIFNPDGSEVDMCGNGSRCAALYAVENNIAPKNMKIETLAGVIDAEVVGLMVKLRLTDPEGLELNKKIKIGNEIYNAHFVNTGVPHAVIFLDDLDKADVVKLGSKLRFHSTFKPEGVNADFVTVLGPKEIKLRTYERGVEAETYACGTGAAASAIISNLIFGLKPHIDVNTKSGEVLRVYFDSGKKKVKNVYLEGEAKVVYKGGISHV